MGYPVTETLFSIARRRLVTRTRAAEPDAQHLHHLVYRWIAMQPWSTDTRLGDLRNPLTTVALWLLNAAAVVPAVYLRDDVISTMLWLGGFVMVYCALYGSLCHGRASASTSTGRCAHANAKPSRFRSLPAPTSISATGASASSIATAICPADGTRRTIRACGAITCTTSTT
ncbi:hypothetical protein [Caballeronia sp. ATUFL_M2_KS44]|uniref:hypothetical protein n=1 Tax=Caballeronia sp. ATUFL_M2_KS44 TaxID=2921767 RepID=UPI002028495B|nr:hypothetical protein [Caballeronia sp. ATUFL_M2_KS44]